MMLGEIDFVGAYVQPYYQNDSDKSIPYPLPTFYILAVFMVLMPILLMNLLIGLAVGDIESVRRNAQLKRLAMQVSCRYILLLNLWLSSTMSDPLLVFARSYISQMSVSILVTTVICHILDKASA